MAVNNVYLDKEKFDMIKHDMSIKEGIDYLVDMVHKQEIPFPYKGDTYEDAWDAFRDLVQYPCKGLQKVDDGVDVHTRFDYRRPFDGYLFDEGARFSAASNHFHEVARMKCTHIHHPIPPEDVWKRDNCLRTAFRALFTMDMPEVSTSSFRTSIQLKFYIASQFRVCNAKAIYQHFNAKNVFDISMGWGDRLAGFWSLPGTKEYWGTDPNKAVYVNYFKQAELYSKINGKKEYHFFNEPAEDILARKDENGEYVVPSNHFDTVFTSPPYFGCEKYSDGEGDNSKQSWKRYDSAVGWLKNFMFPILWHSRRILKPGGYLALNISDISCEGEGCFKRLCDPMCDFVEKYLPNMEYVGQWGMTLSKRPNSKRTKDKDGVFYEPVWVWRKKVE